MYPYTFMLLKLLFDMIVIATGHDCWGILNAPVTGAAMAELIVEGHCSVVDISPFDPQRFYLR